ncbi:MAG: acylphosphatase [bacterium]
MKHYNLTITGKVQGVGFRFMSMQAAYRYHIRGFVQNLMNGAVYIEAEGEEANLKKFIDWCRSGALGAKVDEIDGKQGEIRNYGSFDIKKSTDLETDKYF